MRIRASRTGWARTGIALSALGLLALAACGDRAPPPDAEAVAEHMGEHFVRVDLMHGAIVRGDLDAAREPARWLAEHAALPGLPEAWDPFLPELREAARDVAEASDLVNAGKATARVGATCGECHAALGAEVGFAIEGAVPEGGTAAEHMQRHVWALGRLWEGLVVPSGEIWQAGAAVLEEVPLVPEELTEDRERVAEVRVTAERVHELAPVARQAGDMESRAAVYGDLLGTCARCHAATAAPAI
ncbi:MAG: hypothetical protein RRA92_10225 [Gemmatimonadota bacterium]|nr:hypothetical protein [Gemmatimonadota bacterium]